MFSLQFPVSSIPTVFHYLSALPFSLYCHSTSISLQILVYFIGLSSNSSYFLHFLFLVLILLSVFLGIAFLFFKISFFFQFLFLILQIHFSCNCTSYSLISLLLFFLIVSPYHPTNPLQSISGSLPLTLFFFAYVSLFTVLTFSIP